MTKPATQPKYRPYPDNDPCPCGSGRPYKKCCKKKRFKFVVNQRGQISKRIAIHPRLEPLLKEHQTKFQKVFGRKPGHKDPVLFDHWLSGEDDFWQQARMVGRAANTPEQLIFAWRRTGLIVGEHSRELMPESDFEEWTNAVDEYFAIKEQGYDPFHVFTYLSGEDYDHYKILVERFDDVILAVGCALTNPKRFRERGEYLTYLFFRRALGSLRTIREMYHTRYDDDCLAIARSVYETYLRLKFLRLDPSSAVRFDAIIACNLGVYHTKLKKNGKPNYDIAVDPKTGQEFNVAISNREIIEISDFLLEKALYYDLYPALSGFVHPDLTRVVSIRPSDNSGTFKEGDPIRSSIYVGSVCVLLLLEIGTSKFLTERTKRDVRHILKTLCRAIENLLGSEALLTHMIIPPSIYSLFGFEIQYVEEIDKRTDS